MPGIYPGRHWYKRAATPILRSVQAPPRQSRFGSTTVAILLFTLGGAVAARAQGEPGAPRADVRTVGMDYLYSWFQNDQDPWHVASLSAGYRRGRHAAIARIHLARRFAMNGAQIEVDAYPGIDGATYAYLNIGHSGSTIFPEWRFGAELFRSLPNALEASLGMRQLRFDGAPITLFTGSVGRYSSNYWVSFRPYLREKDDGLTAAATVAARRYRSGAGAGADNYFGARAGYGSTPGDNAIGDQLSRTGAASFTVHGSMTTSPRTITSWFIGFEREGLPLDRVRNRWEVGGGVKLRY
jgi:YaiO family outer membrane protein